MLRQEPDESLKSSRCEQLKGAMLVLVNARVLVLCLLPLLSSSAVASELIGPVLGDVTHHSAKLWVYAEPDAKLELELVPQGQAKVKFEKSKYSRSSNFVFVEGLAANTDYQFEVQTNGKASPLSGGHFTTSPVPGQSSKFSIAVISCLKKTNADWVILEKEKPDYLFMLGDNIYTHQKNRDSFDRMRELYLSFRQNVGFASLVKNRSTLAVWDDHDMGPNDSDGTLEGKEESLKAFMDVWPNPSYGIEQVPGVFFSKQHGDVDFFMLDGRFYRQPKHTDDARMLGDAQFNWLLEKLTASQATFKVIANGSPINHTAKKDGWESWPWARKRLYDAIAANKITGVVFVGGDLHFADVEKIPTEATNISYPIYNVVSSGFTDRKSRPGWNFSKQQNPYVMLNFDTTLKDPSLEIIVKDKLKTYKAVTVKASELK